MHDALDVQLKSTLLAEYHGSFVRKTTTQGPVYFAERDKQLWLKVTDVFQLMGQVLNNRLEAAFVEEETDFGVPSPELASHPLFQRSLSGHRGIVKIDAGLNVPVVELGASTSTYNPPVVQRLMCEMILPSHAGVANTIGVVVGRGTMRASGSIISPSEGHFRVHLSDEVLDFIDEQEALLNVERTLYPQPYPLLNLLVQRMKNWMCPATSAKQMS